MSMQETTKNIAPKKVASMEQAMKSTKTTKTTKTITKPAMNLATGIKTIKEYDNYIFDLYGTLIDIHTDEEQPKLWEKMCDYLKTNFGAEYTAKALRKRYLEICAEEEKELQKRNGADFPEIQIEDVWGKLICEKADMVAHNDDVSNYDNASNHDNVSNHDSNDYSKNLLSPDSQKIRTLCVYFREASRDKLVVYEGVHEIMKKLKEMGKGIYLLSNAQRAFTEKELEDTGLTDYFDDIFISSDKGIKKPEKAFLQQLLDENSLNFDKCVMIGNDIFSDVGVAFKNGMESIFLNTYDFTEKKIDHELSELGITGSELMPVIIGDGDIRAILPVNK